MDENSQKLNPERLKSFVRHLCIIAKKHKDREDARSELQEQIKRLKRFSSKKKGMGEESKELDRRISLVLEKEMQLLGIGKGEGAASRELMRDVSENKEKIRQMNESIKQIRESLEGYVRFKTERERKIEELEKKIRAKAAKKENIFMLRKKLKDLEYLYDKLNKKGIDVGRVASRIEDLKMRLMA